MCHIAYHVMLRVQQITSENFDAYYYFKIHKH